ncbi:transcriptional regulator, partial [Enterobacter hormaechei]|nr:transcriptional regulator [Enterobacter cloacae]
RLEANPASASIDRLYKVFSILGVEITLSSISPSPFISHTEMRGAFDSTPARREKW